LAIISQLKKFPHTVMQKNQLSPYCSGKTLKTNLLQGKNFLYDLNGTPPSFLRRKVCSFVLESKEKI